MTPTLMFGDDSEYQIDHSLSFPFKRSLDDSFVNKVLATPNATGTRATHPRLLSAFSPECGGDPDKYRAMITACRRI